MKTITVPRVEVVPEEGRTVSVVAVAGGSASGPSYCKLCGEWPARQTAKGLRCHLCECRDICADNPVPLPEGRECLQDLASIGVPGADEKLALLPNTQGQTPATCLSRLVRQFLYDYTATRTRKTSAARPNP